LRILLLVPDNEGTGYDSTTQYEANEPMSPAKIKEHEPTIVKFSSYYWK
jgi:hypothetical protein